MSGKPHTQSEIRNQKSEIPRSRRGAVIIVTLLALMLLAGMVFYVLNLGRQVNGRVTTQHAADSAAIGGAGWVARSLNTVAMNNVASTHLIAGLNFLDALPWGVGHTLSEQQAIYRAVDTQMGRLGSVPWLRPCLSDMRDELQKEIDLLQPVDNLLNHSSFDMRTVTYYRGPGGKGQLWTAMESMDQLNQAEMESLGVLAQVNARRAGETNLPGGSGSGAALLVPVAPQVPYVRGQFDDFERPVVWGILPGHDQRCSNPDPVPGGLGVIDDKLTNRGPYDTLFGWREWLGGQNTGHWVDGDSSLAQGGHGIVPIGSNAGADRNAKFVVTGHTPATGYMMYGPFRWMTQRVADFNNQSLYYSRFGNRVNKMANVKLNYVWPHDTVYTPGRPLPLRVRGYRHAGDASPEWEIPLVKDYRYWFDGPNLLRSTPPSNYFYLEDGVNTTSNDLVLRVVDLPNGTTRVTYVAQATRNWVYDVVAADGTIVLRGLGQGVNKGLTGNYSTYVPTPPNQIIIPQWITDFAAAAQLGASDQGAQTILETCFAAIEIKSRYPSSDPRFLSPGTWDYDYSNGGHCPRLVFANGWMDPRAWDVPQVADYIWRDEWSYTTNFDATLGMTPVYVTDPLGNPVLLPQPVYRVDHFVFIGVNVGQRVNVPNPYNFGNRSDLPAPLDLDHKAVKLTADARRQYLTYLGIARRSDDALVWPSKFDGRKPYGNMVALAESQVFNNHSFDLWTQMWTAQVETIRDYNGWVQTFEASAADNRQAPVLAQQELTDLDAYLHGIQPLAQWMLRH